MRPKLTALTCSTLAVLALALATSPADAGWFRHHKARRCTAAARCVAPAARAASPAVATAQAPPVASQDPGSFLAWLNDYRARSGLGPVGHDPSLSGWAASNNGQQNARGMGHHVMGPARRQNAGWGSLATVSVMWAASPAHRAALLDPSITRIGIAGNGAYWTFNAF